MPVIVVYDENGSTSAEEGSRVARHKVINTIQIFSFKYSEVFLETSFLNYCMYINESNFLIKFWNRPSTGTVYLKPDTAETTG